MERQVVNNQVSHSSFWRKFSIACSIFWKVLHCLTAEWCFCFELSISSAYEKLYFKTYCSEYFRNGANFQLTFSYMVYALTLATNWNVKLHPENFFLGSTKISLAQLHFSYKYGSMVSIELAKKVLLIFFFKSNKKIFV